MRKKSNINIFNATNPLKVLSFLVEQPGQEFLGSEVQKATSMSRSGVYVALRELIKQKLVVKAKRGKFLFYSVAHSDPAIKQFKVLKNILLLRHFILKLKPSSKKIILYGSVSRGEDDLKSDLDLFVLSKDPEQTKNIIQSIKIKRRIQMVAKTPSEFSEMKEKDREFYQEVNDGIILWEETE